MKCLLKNTEESMSKLIDANLIIRFLIQDDPVKAGGVQKLLKNSKQPLILTDIVLAELVWTLSSHYHLPKKEISDKLQSLLALNAIESNQQLLSQSLEYYRTFNIDFVDAYLVATAENQKLQGIYSFDKDFDKIKTVKRFEP